MTGYSGRERMNGSPEYGGVLLFFRHSVIIEYRTIAVLWDNSPKVPLVCSHGNYSPSLNQDHKDLEMEEVWETLVKTLVVTLGKHGFVHCRVEGQCDAMLRVLSLF